MKTLIVVLAVVSMLFASTAHAQVDQIKQASSSHSSSSSSHGSSDYSSSDDSDSGMGFFLVDFVFSDMFGGIAKWQEMKVAKKSVNPTVISFDLMLQSAIQ